MSAADLLSRLEAVRETGANRWIAKCPAHDDRSPSLSIRETADGTVLLRCFTGCAAVDVVRSVGLELRDLFPRQADHRGRPLPKRKRSFLDTRAALLSVRHELLVAVIALSDIRAGKMPNQTDLPSIERAERFLARVAEALS